MKGLNGCAQGQKGIGKFYVAKKDLKALFNSGSSFLECGVQLLRWFVLSDQMIFIVEFNNHKQTNKQTNISLEPASPFIWGLSKQDMFCPIEKQNYLPTEIMLTVLQGQKHYCLFFSLHNIRVV